MVSSLVESLQWTVVIPLPVIMELDGLSSNASQLGDAAQAAVAYISSHIRSHALSLKVQTSKGNYLTSLSVRTEAVDFDANNNADKNMDDLILKAAIWQDDHWVDRSSMLKAPESAANELSGAVKVVMLSLDRNRESFVATYARYSTNPLPPFFPSASQSPIKTTPRCKREGLGFSPRNGDIVSCDGFSQGLRLYVPSLRLCVSCSRTGHPTSRPSSTKLFTCDLVSRWSIGVSWLWPQHRRRGPISCQQGQSMAILSMVTL